MQLGQVAQYGQLTKIHFFLCALLDEWTSWLSAVRHMKYLVLIGIAVNDIDASALEKAAQEDA